MEMFEDNERTHSSKPGAESSDTARILQLANVHLPYPPFGGCVSATSVYHMGGIKITAL